jgi:hypothetical protein
MSVSSSLANGKRPCPCYFPSPAIVISPLPFLTAVGTSPQAWSTKTPPPPARALLAVVLPLPAHARAPLNPRKVMPLPCPSQAAPLRHACRTMVLPCAVTTTRAAATSHS